MATLEDVPSAASAWNAMVRRRTRTGVLIAVFLAAIFTQMLLRAQNHVEQAGCGLIVVTMLFLLVQLVARRAGVVPRNIDLSACARFYRSELQRQREFYGGAWLWSRVLAMIPGFALLCTGEAIAQPATVYEQAAILAVFIAVLVSAFPLNRRMANLCSLKISELDLAQNRSSEQ